jgi:hypothetical protein
MINVFSRVLVGMGVVLAVPVCQGMGTISVDFPPAPVLMQKMGILVPDECEVQVYPRLRQVGVRFHTSDIQQALSSISVPEECKITLATVSPGTVNCYVCIALPSPPILMQKLGVPIPEGYNVVINGVPVLGGGLELGVPIPEGHNVVTSEVPVFGVRHRPSTYDTHGIPCLQTKKKRDIMDRPEMRGYANPLQTPVWQWVREVFPEENYASLPKLRETVVELIAGSKGTEYELPKMERMRGAYMPLLLKYIDDNRVNILRSYLSIPPAPSLPVSQILPPELPVPQIFLPV